MPAFTHNIDTNAIFVSTLILGRRHAPAGTATRCKYKSTELSANNDERYSCAHMKVGSSGCSASSSATRRSDSAADTEDAVAAAEAEAS